MVIKDNKGREYTLTSTRLAEVHNPVYFSVFSVTAQKLKQAIKEQRQTQFDAKRTDADGHPAVGARWIDGRGLFPFTSDLTQIGCAVFSRTTAKLIKKTLGINVRKITRG